MHGKDRQMKLPFALWTRIAVQQLIKQLGSIDVPVRTIGDLLLKNICGVPISKIKRR